MNAFQLLNEFKIYLDVMLEKSILCFYLIFKVNSQNHPLNVI